MFVGKLLMGMSVIENINIIYKVCNIIKKICNELITNIIEMNRHQRICNSSPIVTFRKENEK